MCQTPSFRSLRNGLRNRTKLAVTLGRQESRILHRPSRQLAVALPAASSWFDSRALRYVRAGRRHPPTLNRICGFPVWLLVLAEGGRSSRSKCPGEEAPTRAARLWRQNRVPDALPRLYRASGHGFVEREPSMKRSGELPLPRPLRHKSFYALSADPRVRAPVRPGAHPGTAVSGLERRSRRRELGASRSLRPSAACSPAAPTYDAPPPSPPPRYPHPASMVDHSGLEPRPRCL